MILDGAAEGRRSRTSASHKNSSRLSGAEDFAPASRLRSLQRRLSPHISKRAHPKAGGKIVVCSKEQTSFVAKAALKPPQSKLFATEKAM